MATLYRVPLAITAMQFLFKHPILIRNKWVTYRDHVLNSRRVFGAQHHHAHGYAGGLSGTRVVLVQVELELLVDVLPVRSHGS